MIRVRSVTLLVALLLPALAPAQQVAPLPGPAGTWVPPELRRSLERGDRGPLPCWVTVAPDLTAAETCGTAPTSWGQGRIDPDEPGATTVVFPGEPPRRLLHRPGVPHEILVEVGAEDAGQVVRRLYRLPVELEPVLASRELSARLFYGRLQADTGAALSFDPDGTYGWGGERGTYRVDVSGIPAGTSGVLVLSPQGGGNRAYHLTEQGGRIGLSPVQGPWPPPPPPPPRPWAQAGSSGAAVDLGALGSGGAAGTGGAPADQGAAGGTGGAGPAVLPPSVWLTPAPAPQPEEVPDAGPIAAPDAGPPPIARPITPRSRCGCGAVEGSASLAALAALALLRRRAHPWRSMKARITQLQLGPMQNFVYLLGAEGSPEAAVVDPAWDVPAILDAAKAEGRDIAMALLSHHHHDHVNGVAELAAARPGLRVLAQRDELSSLSGLGVAVEPMEPGARVLVGPLEVTCIHTPGHTPGSQCFACGGALVSGDTLFIGGCGRCDLAGGDPHRMFASLHRVLAALPDDTVLYPGHDYADRPTSTLGRERRENPYLTLTSEAGFVAYRMRPRP